MDHVGGVTVITDAIAASTEERIDNSERTMKSSIFSRAIPLITAGAAIVVLFFVWPAIRRLRWKNAFLAEIAQSARLRKNRWI